MIERPKPQGDKDMEAELVGTTLTIRAGDREATLDRDWFADDGAFVSVTEEHVPYGPSGLMLRQAVVRAFGCRQYTISFDAFRPSGR